MKRARSTGLMHNISMLAAAITYVGIGFIGGLLVSNFFGAHTSPPAEAVATIPTQPPLVIPAEAPSPIPAAASPEPDYYGIRYLVRAEEDEIILYETDGETEKILRKSKLNMNSIPARDAEELTKGIKTGTLEGALEILEGFIE